ncbi:unnamed protein product [Peniophora sp. CBMAI 1063]|nr:unnamed protein product [Peniophora sp. CBMAI 1063]
MSKTPNLLQGHRFFVTFCYLPDEQIKLRSLLELNGGTVVETVQDADYIVTDTWEFEDKDDMPENSALVTRKWVEKSLVQGKLLELKEYSPDPSKLFSGVVGCATESSDVEILSTVIEYLGGSWRSGYTRDVTHLFAIRAGSDKYQTAMHFQKETGVKVVVPHWFDDSIHFGCRDLDTTAYEWPNPEVLSGGPAVNRIKPIRRPDLKALHDLPGEKLDLYENVMAAGEPSHQNLPRSLVNDVWDGRKILLSPDLELSPAGLKVVKESIERCGGEIIGYGDDFDAVTLDQFDVLVARHRWGHMYLQAVRAKKTVGSLAWLFYVQSTGALVSPIDQLLHFPIPKNPVAGFDKQEVTVTNYTGQSRDYLKKLIDIMGGKFTASMSGKNTALVAAYLNGQKTDKAQGWGIPIVNHLWLEDCFLQWRTVSVGTEKYVHFPQGLNFAVQLGRSGLDWQTLLDGTQDVEEAMEKDRLARVMAEAQDGLEGPNAGDGAEMEVDDGDEEAPADEDAMDVDDARPPTPPPREAPKRGVKGSAKTTPRQAPGTTLRKPPASSKKQTSDGEASSHEDEDVQSSPTRRPRGRPKRSSSRSGNAPKPKPTTASRPRRSTGGRAKADASPTKSAPHASDTDTDAAPVPSSSAQRVTRSMSRQRADDEDDEAPSKPPSRAAKPKPSTRARKVTVPSEDEDGADEADVVNPRGRTRSRAGPSEPPSKSKASGTKSTAKGKGKAPESRGTASRSTRSKAAPVDKNDDHTDTESEDASPTKAAQARRTDKANAASSPSKTSKPTRRLSVVMPPVGTGRSLSQQSVSRNVSPSKDKGKGKALHNNAAGTATDSDEDEPPTRTAPSKTPAKTPAKSVPQDLTTPSTAGRARRTAADKATRRLHDEIMPDVNNFQQQLRRGNVRALGEKEREAESRAKDKGKDKSKNDEDKKRRRGSADDEEEDAEEEEEEGRDVKKPRTSTKGKAKAGSEDVEDSAKKRTGKGRAKAKLADGSDDEGERNQVRLMTTGWSMADAMGKKLQKLGMKLVSDVKQCTHLVTNRIARTPNFLLAMAVAPIIVDQSWLDACVKKGRILPTDAGEYDLNDPATEAKYDFKLAEAIKRAADNKGTLFEGMTFHVTRSVEVDHKVLRGAIVAHGGTMIDNATLSERTLQGKKEHYVIASPADDRKFPLLLKGGHTIYTPELVLTSALVQEIRWDNPASILAAP